jgi:hypothetical protein
MTLSGPLPVQLQTRPAGPVIMQAVQVLSETVKSLCLYLKICPHQPKKKKKKKKTKLLQIKSKSNKFP